jgi:hypothetical protein
VAALGLPLDTPVTIALRVTDELGGMGEDDALLTISASDCPGDADGDGLVGNTDLQRLLDAWGASSGDPRYDAAVDFDSSGTIENFDLQVLIDNWARDCTP